MWQVREPMKRTRTHKSTMRRYKGPFEDLFETTNLYSEWEEGRGPALVSLYYDCKAKKSMRDTYGDRKIKKGEVMDLVLRFKDEYDHDENSHYYAFSESLCKRDETTIEEIRRIKRVMIDFQLRGDKAFKGIKDHEYPEDATMALIYDTTKLVCFMFHDPSSSDTDSV